jgi:pyridoxamine 5'-phosphate oxidase
MTKEFSKEMQMKWQPQSTDDVVNDPYALFTEWFTDAKASEINDPNAMALATIDKDDTPSVRMVLLKDYDQKGFVFYTNKESRKGLALQANPRAALLFHWKSLGRQIRIEGPVSYVSDAESDEYYASRPRGSRIGAWASQQSQPIASRAELEARVEVIEKQYEGQDIPRPAHWGGYLVAPKRIEFWHEGPYRLHSRIVFTATANGWEKSMICP